MRQLRPDDAEKPALGFARSSPYDVKVWGNYAYTRVVWSNLLFSRSLIKFNSSVVG